MILWVVCEAVLFTWLGLVREAEFPSTGLARRDLFSTLAGESRGRCVANNMRPVGSVRGHSPLHHVDTRLPVPTAYSLRSNCAVFVVTYGVDPSQSHNPADRERDRA